MPQISRNIIDNTIPILVQAKNPNGITISSLSLCNVSVTPVTLSISKVFGANADQTYYKVQNMILAPSTTFMYEGIQLAGNWSLNLTIAGGNVDMDLVYINNNVAL